MIHGMPEFEPVAEVSSGADAMVAADAVEPDLVLIDVHMPEMNGIETSRKLSASHPEMVLVLISTADPSELPAAARSCGAADLAEEAGSRARGHSGHLGRTRWVLGFLRERRLCDSGSDVMEGAASEIGVGRALRDRDAPATEARCAGDRGQRTLRGHRCDRPVQSDRRRSWPRRGRVGDADRDPGRGRHLRVGARADEPIRCSACRNGLPLGPDVPVGVERRRPLQHREDCALACRRGPALHDARLPDRPPETTLRSVWWSWPICLLIITLYLPTAFVSEQFVLPFPLTTCTADCPTNAFMLTGSEPGFLGEVEDLRDVLAVLLFTAAVSILALRIKRATPLMRPMLVPVLAMAIVRLLAVGRLSARGAQLSGRARSPRSSAGWRGSESRRCRSPSWSG